MSADPDLNASTHVVAIKLASAIVAQDVDTVLAMYAEHVEMAGPEGAMAIICAMANLLDAVLANTPTRWLYLSEAIHLMAAEEDVSGPPPLEGP